MRHILFALFVFAGCCFGFTDAQAAPAPFSSWIFSLSWSPEYCKANLESKEPQCVEETYFVVDGLIPHVGGGDDQACPGNDPVPKELIDRMLPIMRNVSTIRRAWKRQGACSGLPMQEYFLQVERMARKLVMPEAYKNLMEEMRTDAATVKAAFAQANDGLSPDAIHLVCKGRYVSQVQLCLSRGFDSQGCGVDLGNDCGADVRLRSFGQRMGM